jgi:hypothetical protein
MQQRQRQRRINEDKEPQLSVPQAEVFDTVGKPLPTSFDAGVDLRDVQIAAPHADPRTTMRYDRARKNLDCHPNYILAAYMASGTRPNSRLPKLRPRETPGIADECALG